MATPLASPSAGDGPRFRSLDASQTGVDFTNPLDLDHPLKRIYHSGFACGGIAVGDVDGDGRPDLYLTNGPRRNRLYRQTGDLEFEDITDRAGVGSVDRWSAGVAMADVDNDGDLDIYVCNYDEPNQLFINDGSGRFTDAAEAFGVDLVDASLMPTFCDYDGDGHLDLFVLTNHYYRAGGRPEKPPFRMRSGQPEVLPEFQKYYKLVRQADGSYQMDNAGRSDYLLHNEGDGTFRDVSREAGIVQRGHGLSATWWDYNHDGRPDLYVGNDFNDPDHLYHNNGDGTFDDRLEQVIPHTSWFSMGADFGDLNGDGRFDLLVADMSATTHFGQKTTMGAMNAERLALVAGPPPQIMKNALYLSSGADRFFEAAELAGLADSDWTWAIKLADFDNDGRTDVYVSNGMARSFNNSDLPLTPEKLIGRTAWDLYEDTPPRREQNLAYRNTGDIKFEDVSSDWGLDKVGMSYAAAYADFDRDGDLDLVVANLDEPVSIYRNDSAEGNRLLVALRGNPSNHFGIGAVVKLHTPSGSQVRMLSPQTGFLSSNDSVLHFGLGDESQVSRLTIDWPSGTRQVIEDVPTNHLLTIQEQASSAADPSADPPLPMFASDDRLAAFRHREQPYDDFARQPLLPNKLSQLGPGLAVADVNGDGYEDVYLSGARGQTGMLLLGNQHGRFSRQQVPAFREDRQSEDMAAVWIDADADGDLDLYVVSGGVECAPGAAELRDRLYLNDGQGNFSKAPAGSLPDVADSGSIVCAADFDRDGLVDLMVGSRVIPGAYPESPTSRLLKNEGGRFVDVTDEVAPALKSAGLVTSGVWSDVDDDGWLDLLLTTEWGPVRLLRNREDKLEETTEAAGLADALGWFNGIAARDFDGDGDIDYAVTNFGLNTKYHASRSKPVLLYYGDFEGNGKKRLVEAEYEDQHLYPIRGKSCSTQAMPSLGDKFTNYREFAAATLEDIYTPRCLDDADRFECNTLESVVLWNDGAGRFRIQPLPRLAQVSPSFGVLATEVNGDGWPDLYLVQNFFTPQVETGRMDGGMSILLLGSEAGEFEPVVPGRSGLVVTGDATAAVEVHFSGQSEPTWLVGLNDDSPVALARLPRSANADQASPKLLKVALRGDRGNPAAYGARVTVVAGDDRQQTAEVTAGQGYLSQTSPILTFAAPPDTDIKNIRVRWPDGTTSTHIAEPSEVQAITKPD